MKNELKIFLLILIGIFACSTTNVNAAVIFPATYEGEGITYAITKSDILCYDYNEYMNLTPDAQVKHTINIPANDITLNPSIKYYDAESLGKNAESYYSVKLNFSSTTPPKNLIESKINELSTNAKYVCTLSIDYDILKVPTKYSTINHIGFLPHNSGNVVTNATLNTTIPTTGILENYKTTQTIDAWIVTIESQNTAINATVEDFTEGIHRSLFDYDVLVKPYQTSAGEQDIPARYVTNFLLHDYDEIDSYINDLYNKSSSLSGDNVTDTSPTHTETKQIQKVTVPNTAANDSSKLLLGSSIMLLGSAIVLFQLRKKFVKQ